MAQSGGQLRALLQEGVVCTACGGSTGAPRLHPRLEIVMCDDCFLTYEEREEQGNSTAFPRCGLCSLQNVGSIVPFKFCSKDPNHLYCANCICRNSGPEKYDEIFAPSSASWECYSCNTSQLAAVKAASKLFLEQLGVEAPEDEDEENSSDDDEIIDALTEDDVEQLLSMAEAIEEQLLNADAMLDADELNATRKAVRLELQSLFDGARLEEEVRGDIGRGLSQQVEKEMALFREQWEDKREALIVQLNKLQDKIAKSKRASQFYIDVAEPAADSLEAKAAAERARQAAEDELNNRSPLLMHHGSVREKGASGYTNPRKDMGWYEALDPVAARQIDLPFAEVVEDLADIEDSEGAVRELAKQEEQQFEEAGIHVKASKPKSRRVSLTTKKTVKTSAAAAAAEKPANLDDVVTIVAKAPLAAEFLCSLCEELCPSSQLRAHPDVRLKALPVCRDCVREVKHQRQSADSDPLTQCAWCDGTNGCGRKVFYCASCGILLCNDCLSLYDSNFSEERPGVWKCVACNEACAAELSALLRAGVRPNVPKKPKKVYNIEPRGNAVTSATSAPSTPEMPSEPMEVDDGVHASAAQDSEDIKVEDAAEPGSTATRMSLDDPRQDSPADGGDEEAPAAAIANESGQPSETSKADEESDVEPGLEQPGSDRGQSAAAMESPTLRGEDEKASPVSAVAQDVIIVTSDEEPELEDLPEMLKRSSTTTAGTSSTRTSAAVKRKASPEGAPNVVVDDAAKRSRDEGSTEGCFVVNPEDRNPIYLSKFLSEKLKPHQKEGVQFMWKHCIMGQNRKVGGGCVLAHSMGLGKTLQVVAFLSAARDAGLKRFLIIAPKSTINPWMEELRHNLQKGNAMPLASLTSKNIDSDLVTWESRGGVALITYGYFTSLVSALSKTNTKRSANVTNILLNPSIVVLDEGHLLNNPASIRSKAINQIKTKRRIVLTGTPLQNRLEDLHAVFSFVRPEVLPPLSRYRQIYVNPIKAGSYHDSDAGAVRLMKYRLHALHKKVSKFMFRKGFEILRTSLPPKREYVLSIKLSPLQWELYAYLLDLIEHAAQRPNFIELYRFLQPLLDHPLFLKTPAVNAPPAEAPSAPGAASSEPAATPTPLFANWFLPKVPDSRFSLSDGGKLPVALAIIQEALQRKEKVLLFSQSIAVLEVLGHLLSKMVKTAGGAPFVRKTHFDIFTGKESSESRQEMQKKINTPTNPCCVLLISVKAGGVGINLAGASRAILYDVNWNPAMDLQAIFRCYRYGQTRPVTIYRLVCDGCLEEKMYIKAAMKQMLSARVVDKEPLNRWFTRASEQTAMLALDSPVPADSRDPQVRLAETCAGLGITAEQGAELVSSVEQAFPLLAANRLAQADGARSGAQSEYMLDFDDEEPPADVLGDPSPQSCRDENEEDDEGRDSFERARQQVGIEYKEISTVPEDEVLAAVFTRLGRQWVSRYHSFDALLVQNLDEQLSVEEEEQALRDLEAAETAFARAAAGGPPPSHISPAAAAAAAAMPGVPNPILPPPPFASFAGVMNPFFLPPHVVVNPFFPPPPAAAFGGVLNPLLPQPPPAP